MNGKLYKAIRIEDYNDEPVQYAAVYVTQWNDAIMGEPAMLFVESDPINPYGELYHAVNALMLRLSANGEYHPDMDEVSNVMNALQDIDEGIYKPEKPGETNDIHSKTG